MKYNIYAEIVNRLRQKGIEFAAALSDEEFAWIAREYGIVFPEELKRFYQEALPVSAGFYDWRDQRPENVARIKHAMRVPVQGLIDHAEEIDWNEAWGEEPDDPNERRKRIADMARKAPKLIPIYAHRYMAEMGGKDLPVLSICGTDLIYFARNITDYFLIEFHEKENDILMNDEVRYVPFWSDLL